MFEKKIKYVDFNGTEREETFRFNLTKTEVLRWTLTTTGGLEEKIKGILEAQDIPEIMRMFEDLIRMSYGVKSEDGRRFIKNDEVFTEFYETEAYSNLILELATDEASATQFIKEVIPKDLDSVVK